MNECACRMFVISVTISGHSVDIQFFNDAVSIACRTSLVAEDPASIFSLIWMVMME